MSDIGRPTNFVQLEVNVPITIGIPPDALQFPLDGGNGGDGDLFRLDFKISWEKRGGKGAHLEKAMKGAN